MHNAVITTQRLRLCSPQANDLDWLYSAILANEDIMRLVFSGNTFSRRTAETFFITSFDHDSSGIGHTLIIEKTTGQLIGFAGLIPCRTKTVQHDFSDDLELGFVLMPQARGKGYARELCKAQIQFAITTLARLRVLALTSPLNAPVLRVLHDCNMRHLYDIDHDKRGPRCVFVADA